MITLTRVDFSQFNLKSKLNLIKKDGKLLATKLTDLNIYSMYCIYGFYVEMVYDQDKAEIIKVNLLNNVQWKDFYNKS